MCLVRVCQWAGGAVIRRVATEGTLAPSCVHPASDMLRDLVWLCVSHHTPCRELVQSPSERECIRLPVHMSALVWWPGYEHMNLRPRNRKRGAASIEQRRCPRGPPPGHSFRICSMPSRAMTRSMCGWPTMAFLQAAPCIAPKARSRIPALLRARRGRFLGCTTCSHNWALFIEVLTAPV